MSRRQVLTVVSLLLLTSAAAFGSSYKVVGNYAVGSRPMAIVAGDFNGDGKIDLAVANSASRTVSLLLGNGDGTFRAQVEVSEKQAPPELMKSLEAQPAYRSGTQMASTVFADFNGDGKMDEAVTMSGRNLVSVLLNVTEESDGITNLIKNSGFEAGTLSPWAQGRDYCSGTCKTWAVLRTDPRSGHYDAGNEGNIELVQDFTATETSSIGRVVLWIRHPSEAGVAAAIDFFYSDGADNEYVVTPSDTNWDSFDVTGDLTAGESLDGFSIWGYSGGVGAALTFVDGVEVAAN